MLIILGICLWFMCKVKLGIPGVSLLVRLVGSLVSVQVRLSALVRLEVNQEYCCSDRWSSKIVYAGKVWGLPRVSVLVTWVSVLGLCAVKVGDLPWVSALVRIEVCLGSEYLLEWISTCDLCAGHFSVMQKIFLSHWSHWGCAECSLQSQMKLEIT